MINHGYEQVIPRGKFSRSEELNGRILHSKGSFGVLCKRPLLLRALGSMFSHPETWSLIPEQKNAAKQLITAVLLPSFIQTGILETITRRVSWVLQKWKKNRRFSLEQTQEVWQPYFQVKIRAQSEKGPTYLKLTLWWKDQEVNLEIRLISSFYR